VAPNWKHSVHQYILQMLLYLTLLWAESGNIACTTIFCQHFKENLTQWGAGVKVPFLDTSHIATLCMTFYSFLLCIHWTVDNQWMAIKFYSQEFYIYLSNHFNLCWSLRILTTSQQDLYVCRHASHVWFYNVYLIKCFKHTLYTRMKTHIISPLQVFCKFNGFWGVYLLPYFWTLDMMTMAFQMHMKVPKSLTVWW
jgi:hypothetical protein